MMGSPENVRGLFFFMDVLRQDALCSWGVYAWAGVLYSASTLNSAPLAKSSPRWLHKAVKRR